MFENVRLEAKDWSLDSAYHIPQFLAPPAKLPGIPANIPTPVPTAVFSDNEVTVAWDRGDDSGAHIELREVVIVGRSSILETRNSSTIPVPTNVAHFKSQLCKPRVETWQPIQNHH